MVRVYADVSFFRHCAPPRTIVQAQPVEHRGMRAVSSSRLALPLARAARLDPASLGWPDEPAEPANAVLAQAHREA
jgi:hypothetical protein